MRKTSDEPSVIVLADADDVGVSRLVSNLAARLRVQWWRFGLPETSVSVDLDDSGFHVKQPGVELCSNDLARAPVIVFRRRLLQPRALVASGLSSSADRAFSEREWTSLIEGLLLAEERRIDATWLNAPSATLLTTNKLSLLLHAAQAGLPLPAFSVSTPVRFPPSEGEHLVTKAISSDERIDGERYFPTALLTASDLRELAGVRVPTPTLLQEYVPPHLEIRVFYVLGEFLSLALTPSQQHVDIRYAAAGKLTPRRHDLPSELRTSLAGVARAFGLHYCTFDLVVPRGGSPTLVDITPIGGWDHFETDQHPIVTGFVGDMIVKATEHALERPPRAAPHD